MYFREFVFTFVSPVPQQLQPAKTRMNDSFHFAAQVQNKRVYGLISYQTGALRGYFKD